MLQRKEVENDVYVIARSFAIRIVNMYKYLREEKGEFIMSKQVFRSGTSIGANVFEGKNAQSRPDFTTKMNIALKEATETGYWLDLLHETRFLNDETFESIMDDCNKIIAVLTKIVKATKN
ncbi:MAG: four helix bundle protein [Prevotella sp.]|nr:four helix bundle protein [Prevotella sp.]